jgi:hypothetical protein
MTFKVLHDFDVETPSGVLTLKTGQVIRLSKDEAIPLIEEGAITPAEKAIYRIYSNILEDYLWVVETERDGGFLRKRGETGAVYTFDECQRLQGKDPQHLRAVHSVKKIFENSEVVKEDI